MMKNSFCTLLALSLLLPLFGFVYTDPQPNPFTALKAEEALHDGFLTEVTSERFTAVSLSGLAASGTPSALFRYRLGGGAAAWYEFSPGDRVRFLAAGTALTAVQSADIIKSGTEFYGTVTRTGTDAFLLSRVDDISSRVAIGSSTQYRDISGNTLIGYSPRVGDALRVHGAYSTTTNQLFAESLGSYITLLTADSLTPLAEAAAATQKDLLARLSDITAADTAILTLMQSGIITGYPDGTFRPAQPVNRAEFAKLIVASRIPAAADSALPVSVDAPVFSDVPADAWYAPFVTAGAVAHFFSGYADGTFRPEATITLAEALKILTNAYAYTVPAPQSGEAWYAPYLTLATQKHLTPLLDPAHQLTRSDTAHLIHSFTTSRYVTTLTQ